MRQGSKMVSFVVPERDDGHDGERMVLRPERAVQTGNLGIWFGVATLLWSLLVIPALVI